MRLTECGAHFFDTWCGAKGVGLMFYCPLCVRTGRPEEDRHLLPVSFRIALDGSEVPEETRRWTEKDANGVEIQKVFTLPRWNRTGNTIETLTLSPSIDASGQDHVTHKGWHGHVTNGEITGGGI